MEPTTVFLIAALTGLGTFCGWLVKWAFAHLESDLAYSRKTSERGTATAEKAVTVAERTADA